MSLPLTSSPLSCICSFWSIPATRNVNLSAGGTSVSAMKFFVVPDILSYRAQMSDRSSETMLYTYGSLKPIRLLSTSWTQSLLIVQMWPQFSGCLHLRFYNVVDVKIQSKPFCHRILTVQQATSASMFLESPFPVIKPSPPPLQIQK